MKFKGILVSALSTMLFACGGGGGGGGSGSTTSPSTTDPVVAAAPAGLYFGYYMEDPATNPEDPTLGAIYMDLPADNMSFKGAMSFTYVGCQANSIATIAGMKATGSLSGTWSGPIDNVTQSGAFSGSYMQADARYTGTYTVDGGKQFRDLQPCISYYIGPNGTWELFPVGVTVSTQTPIPAEVAVAGNTVSWGPLNAATYTLVGILDIANASVSAGQAIVYQTIVVGNNFNISLPPGTLQAGREYAIAVASVHGGIRTYYSSKKFVAQ